MQLISIPSLTQWLMYLINNEIVSITFPILSFRNLVRYGAFQLRLATLSLLDGLMGLMAIY